MELLLILSAAKQLKKIAQQIVENGNLLSRDD
jgi:hypothetical protein